MLKWIQGYKKLDYDCLKLERFEVKPYLKSMKVNDSRLYFKVRNKNVPNIKVNFKSDRKFTAEGWICNDCMQDYDKTSFLQRC